MATLRPGDQLNPSQWFDGGYTVEAVSEHHVALSCSGKIPISAGLKELDWLLTKHNLQLAAVAPMGNGNGNGDDSTYLIMRRVKQ